MNPSEQFNKYLFEYRFDGGEWIFTILARSPAEAQERVKALIWAKYKGEVHATIPIPAGGLITRIIRKLRGDPSC